MLTNKMIEANMPITKVMPITLTRTEEGKKEILSYAYNKWCKGLYPNETKVYEGVENYALSLQDYPNLIVLDLDIKEHILNKYIDSTYTQSTQNGHHLYFVNNTPYKHRRAKKSLNFDLLVGKSWVFAHNKDWYTPKNDKAIQPMPDELLLYLAGVLDDDGLDDLDSLDNNIKIDEVGNVSRETLPSNRHNSYNINFIITKVRAYLDKHNIINSSEMAFIVAQIVVVYVSTPYTLEVCQKVHTLIGGIDDKHITRYEKYLMQQRNFWIKIKPLWRPLGDFIPALYGGKVIYVDSRDLKLVQQTQVELMLPPNVKLKDAPLLQPYIEQVEFNPKNPPSLDYDTQTFNLWGGYKSTKEVETKQEDIDIWLDYLYYTLCGQNKINYTYLLNYLAHIVQKPYELPEVAIVLFGAGKGTGKDTLHALLAPIFNKTGYVKLTSQTLKGRFNAVLEECIIGVAEELVFGGSHSEDSALKSMITAHTHSIERKGFEVVSVKNYLRLFVTSNSYLPVKATFGERRFFALSPQELYKKDRKYWDRLYAIDPLQILKYLQQVDITYYHPRNVPTTSELKELIDVNKSKLEVDLTEWYTAIEKMSTTNATATTLVLEDVYFQFSMQDKYLTKAKLKALLAEVSNNRIAYVMLEGKECLTLLNITAEEIKVTERPLVNLK